MAYVGRCQCQHTAGLALQGCIRHPCKHVGVPTAGSWSKWEDNASNTHCRQAQAIGASMVKPLCLIRMDPLHPLSPSHRVGKVHVTQSKPRSTFRLSTYLHSGLQQVCWSQGSAAWKSEVFQMWVPHALKPVIVRQARSKRKVFLRQAECINASAEAL